MPVLAHIYDKEAFGTFGVLNNLIMVSATIIGFKLSEAFILDMQEGKFKALARTSMHVILIGILIMFLVCALIGPILFQFLGLSTPYWVALVIPIFSGCFALEELQINYIRRLKEFKRSATVASSMVLTSRLAAIGFGFGVVADFTGLLFKELLRVLGNLFIRSRIILSGKPFPVKIGFSRWSEVRAVLKEYYQFPRYQMPSVLAGMLYGSIPLYFIGGHYGIDALGDFTMVITLLGFPLLILTNSIVSVFQRSAADWVNNDPDKLSRASFYVLVALTFIAACGFGLVYWFGESIFSLYLGEKWKTAGAMAIILSPLFLARTVAPIMESLRVVMHTQNLNLVFRILALTTTLLCFILGRWMNWDLDTVLHYMTVINSALILTSILSVLHKLRVNLFKATLALGSVILLGLGIAFTPNFFL